MLAVTKNISQLACRITRHCDVSLSPPLPRGWNSMAGLVPEGHRILIYDQELEKEVDLDILIFQVGRIQSSLILPPCL